jgi:hypothetical protein
MNHHAADLLALTGKLVVGLAGTALTAVERQWLAQHQPAGVILFARNVVSASQLTDLCRELKEILSPGAEIVADHEGGPISVLAKALGRPPAPFGLGILDDTDLTRRIHHDTAVCLREVGIDRVLAPCADVLVEPRNPVIGVRAFGRDAQTVARHVTAAVQGLREGGSRCCLKHWPGHGGTRLDSHKGPVQTAGPYHDLPFAAGLAAGADALLLGHLPWQSRQSTDHGRSREASGRRPSGETSVQVPATLDPEALAAARRVTPGFSAHLYADDVTMGALRPYLIPQLGEDPYLAQAGTANREGLLDPALLPQAWFAILARAGCDFLLCRGIPWKAFPLPNVPTGRSPVAREAPAAAEPADTSRPRIVPQGRWLPAEDWPASYSEARRRLVAQAVSRRGIRLELTADPLLWWDGTRDDRWGDASSLEIVLRRQGLTWRRFDLSRLREEGPQAAEEAMAPGKPFTFLLVTSHRPLDPTALRQVVQRLPMAATGWALVMGHPDLAQVIAALVPGGWSVSAGYDMGPEDLQAWLA